MPRADEMFRAELSPADEAAIGCLAENCGVFSADEVAIAKELAAEHLARGATASGYYFLLAEGASGMDGFVTYGPVPGTKNRWELYWIAVHHRARRQGLGGRLNAAVERKVREAGGVMLIAETSTLPSYANAREFYRKQGYRLLAEVPDWHDDGDGMAIYGKRL